MRLRCIILLVLTGSMNMIRAQTQADSVKISTLQEVTVRDLGRLHPASITPAQTLRRENLINMNSLSVADAVRYFSGLQLKDYGGVGGLKTVDTRSLGSQHTAVFYDGIALGNAQNGQVDLGRFSLDNMEEITVYNAQRGEIFQPARAFASAAAIYLRTRVPVFSAGESTHLKATMKAGSFGLSDPSLLWEQKISNRLSASLGSEWIHANGRYTFRYTNGLYDTTATRQNADLNAWRTEGALHATLRDSSLLDFKAYYYGSQRGLPGAVVANKFESGQRQWDENFFVQSSYNKTIGLYSLLLNAKWATDYLRYLDPQFVTTDGKLDNRYHQKEFYFSMANRFRISSWWELSLSSDLQWNRLDANLYRFAYPRRLTSLVSAATEFHLGRLTMQGGALQTVTRERVKDYGAAENRNRLTPFVSVAVDVLPELRVRAFYKNIFRLPTFNDLYYTFTGNTGLRPEFARQYDAGFTWTRILRGRFQSVSVQADAYYNQVTDKIVAVPTTNLYRWMMLNLGRVNITGTDIGANTSMLVSKEVLISTSVRYSWQHAVDETPGASNKGQQIPYAPKHSGSVAMSASWKSVRLNYSFLYTGDRYSQKANIPVNHLEPWYTHDVSVSRWFGRNKKRWQLSAEVNNLLNQYYDVIINFPMPGRYFRIGATINL